MAFRRLYPPLRPYSSGWLAVDDIHNLYWEQSGNPDGVPVVVLHGGPGAGATGDHRRMFDPEFYRIVIFDQRGAGRSQPLGEIRQNSPDALVSDIEALRKHLNINKWHVFGGSWGATLAILYAGQYAGHCASLIIRSVSLMTRKEIDWYLYGMRSVFPEVWERFAGHVDFADDLLEAYWQRLDGPDEAVRTAAGIAWAEYEGACATFYPQFMSFTEDEQRKRATAMARIEAHFFKNYLFDEKNSLLARVDAFRRVPSVIIHGRYDMITPLKNAHDLHRAWPEADYVIVPDGGHAAFDPAIRDRLVAATDNARSIR